MKTQNFMANQISLQKNVASFQSNLSSQSWWNRWGLKIVPERARSETPLQFTVGIEI